MGSWRNSTSSCNSRSGSEALSDEALTEGELMEAADSKYPMAPNGRCEHREHWERLRGKRGCSYFVCQLCSVGWRQQAKTSKHSRGHTSARHQHQPK